MNSLEFFGLILGIFLVISYISFVISKRRGEAPPKYDERQMLVRGQAYRATFWVLVAYLCISGFFSLIAGTEWADGVTSPFIGVCLAITVFVVICIKKDAYFPVNQQPRFYIVLFGIIIPVNLATGIIRLVNESDSFFTNGALNYNVMPFIICVMFSVILATLIIRRRKDNSPNGRVEP